VAKKAKYFSRAERQIYRLRFKGGVVYQYKWWRNPPSMGLTLAESSRAYTPLTRSGIAGSENYGGFIMTVERELFMAKHELGEWEQYDGVYHSSYTAGKRVIMAGTMLIKGGVIRAIRADSGHYQPTDMNMAALLQALGMFGVSLCRIQLFDYKNNPLGTAVDFLKARVSWDKFVQQRKDEQEHRKEGDKFRKAYMEPMPAPQAPATPTVKASPGDLSNAYQLTK
jgi:hypothetical protein